MAASSISQSDLISLLGIARQWLQSPAGEMLLAAERVTLEKAMTRCFGQHMVTYGLATQPLTDNHQSLRHHWRIDLQADGEALPVDESYWPFAPHSLDAVLLHHGLDFCLSPRTVLREASQTVRAGGHLLIFGFNPWSLWGMNHLVGREWFSEAGFVSPARLVDWLELLGFAVEKRQGGCYRPPLASARWLEHLTWMEGVGSRYHLPGAGFYFIQARRQMFGMTPRQQRTSVFPALTLPPLVAGNRKAHKRNQ